MGLTHSSHAYNSEHTGESDDGEPQEDLEHTAVQRTEIRDDRRGRGVAGDVRGERGGGRGSSRAKYSSGVVEGGRLIGKSQEGPLEGRISKRDKGGGSQAGNKKHPRQSRSDVVPSLPGPTPGTSSVIPSAPAPAPVFTSAHHFHLTSPSPFRPNSQESTSQSASASSSKQQYVEVMNGFVDAGMDQVGLMDDVAGGGLGMSGSPTRPSSSQSQAPRHQHPFPISAPPLSLPNNNRPRPPVKKAKRYGAPTTQNNKSIPAVQLPSEIIEPDDSGIEGGGGIGVGLTWNEGREGEDDMMEQRMEVEELGENGNVVGDGMDLVEDEGEGGEQATTVQTPKPSRKVKLAFSANPKCKSCSKLNIDCRITKFNKKGCVKCLKATQPCTAVWSGFPAPPITANKLSEMEVRYLFRQIGAEKTSAPMKDKFLEAALELQTRFNEASGVNAAKALVVSTLMNAKFRTITSGNSEFGRWRSDIMDLEQEIVAGVADALSE